MTQCFRSDRIGDQEQAQQELDELTKQSCRTEEEKNIFRFDDGDIVDYRLPPNTSFADGLLPDERGYKEITWNQLKKRFCYERPAHGFKVVGDVSSKDMTHWERSKSVKVRDREGTEAALFFYEDESRPHFRWEDLNVGSEVEILSPRFHRFMDGQDGMRVEHNNSIGYVKCRRLTDEMRLDYGRQNKDAGNKLFAEKKYDNALSSYDQALNHLEGTFRERPDLEPQAKEQAAACYLNIAAVRIAEKKWSLVEMPCERALNINANGVLNAKAYFRLAQAYLEQKELAAASDKLQRAIQLVPGDPLVTSLLDEVERQRAECKAAQKLLFSSMSARKNQRSEFGFRENLLVEAPETLESIPNFRDLGGMATSAGCIRPRLLYRSSNFLDASKHDVLSLLDPFGIKTIVDLRNSRETDSYLQVVKKRLQLQGGSPSGFFDYRTKFLPINVIAKENTAACKIEVTKEARRSLSENRTLISSDRVALPKKGSKDEIEVIMLNCRVALCLDLGTRSILSLLSWWRMLCVFALGFLFMIRYASKVVVINTAQRVGPLRLYMTILEKQRPELRYIFAEILSNAANYPVVIACSLGKDRTGVVVALLLSVCGVLDEEIVQDYAKTGALLSVELKSMNSDLGLGPEWSETPPQLMYDFLAHVKERYGGSEAFLQMIGVPSEAITNIRTILVGKRRK